MARDGLLLQQALPGKPHAGLWEFPGGKVEAEEIRVLPCGGRSRRSSALNLDERCMTPAGFADDPGGEGRPAIVLILYECPRGMGSRDPRRAGVGLVHAEEAAGLPMPPIDRALLAGLAKRGIAKPRARTYVPPSKRARSSAG